MGSSINRNLGIVGEHCGDLDPLAHAAREVLGKEVGEALEAHEAQVFIGDAAALGPAARRAAPGRTPRCAGPERHIRIASC